MVYLSIKDDTRDLYLFINSPGGWVIPRIAIYDAMQFVSPRFGSISSDNCPMKTRFRLSNLKL
ncbi:hypothetical protein AMTRI_Chr01g134150 [Amborella trichopoda]